MDKREVKSLIGFVEQGNPTTAEIALLGKIESISQNFYGTGTPQEFEREKTKALKEARQAVCLWYKILIEQDITDKYETIF